MAQKDPKKQQAADRVYEDFEPLFDWAQDQESDTLILMLQGFRKENLRIQISPTRILKVSGERQINENIWRRFSKKFTLPPDSDTNGIGAKLLERGLLYVRLPKVTSAVKPAATPTPEAPNHQADDREKPKEDKAAEAKTENTEALAPAPTQQTKQEEPKTNELSQKKPEEEKEQPSDQAKKKGKKREAGVNNVVQEIAEATSSKARKMHESPDGLGKGEAKIEERSPTLYGLIVELRKQKKLTNLLVVIFLVLVLIGLYVRNAIKSYFGGSRIQEL